MHYRYVLHRPNYSLFQLRKIPIESDAAKESLTCTSNAQTIPKSVLYWQLTITVAKTEVLLLQVIADKMQLSLKLVALAAATALLAEAKKKSDATCPPGQYYHDRGSYDCAPTQCDDKKPGPECCCDCTSGFYCPGTADPESQYAEEPCLPGSSSPPQSTDFSNCSLPAPPVGQVHVAYTGVPGQLSVDFVCQLSGPAYAYTSTDGATWSSAAASTFLFRSVGYMAQALLQWGTVTAGQKVHYMVGCPGANSSVWTVTPILDTSSKAETFVVYGDFGAANDVCMASLIADARNGDFDTVLHVGDWAYNFETANSTVGNVFMSTIQAYAAQHPTMPTEGNHEACEVCPAVPVVPYSVGNFSEYNARMWSVASVGAAKTSGTGTPRYYSFEQGLAHFLVFTAEAYAYKSGKEFLANQLSFMKSDLAGVDRSKTPWVVGLVHKCFWMEAEAYADFNSVLMDGGVDIIFCGHVHNYNRLYPYDLTTGKLDKGSVSKDGSTYTDPKYPVNVVTGAPGDREDSSAYTPGDPSYTGTSDYGYGFVTFPDATHAVWNFKAIKAARGDPGNYTDSLTIVKSKHGLRNGGKALFE